MTRIRPLKPAPTSPNSAPTGPAARPPKFHVAAPRTSHCPGAPKGECDLPWGWLWLLPAALLEQYTFWQLDDGSMRGIETAATDAAGVVVSAHVKPAGGGGSFSTPVISEAPWSARQPR